MLKNKWQSIIIWSERRKRGRVRAEPSDPKRTMGSFRCRVRIHRQIRTSPIFYKVSRVPHQLRVPWEVPTPIAHHKLCPCGGGIPYSCTMAWALIPRNMVLHFENVFDRNISYPLCKKRYGLKAAISHEAGGLVWNFVFCHIYANFG